MSSIRFFDQLLNLRISAALIYDRGRASGRGDEELQATLEPLRTAMDRLVEHALENDLPGILCAIRRLEGEARLHEDDAKMLVKKSLDTREHITRLQTDLKNMMKRRGTHTLHAGDFSVTLTTVEGDEILNIR